eukprot:5297372-Pyramimonas_sp.AAC.1
MRSQKANVDGKLIEAQAALETAMQEIRDLRKVLNGQVSKNELVQAQAALAKAKQSETEARAVVEQLRQQQN